MPSLRLTLAALLAVLSTGAAAARIERSQVSVPLPPGRSVLSPYVEAQGGGLVLHVQPAQAAQAEVLDRKSVV